MPTTTVPGGASGRTSLSAAERHAAQQVLEKLKQGSARGLQLTGAMESATVYSGSTGAHALSRAGLGASSLIYGHGSDTFMGGVRSTLPDVASRLGNDTVVSGSVARPGGSSSPETLAGRGTGHFSLSGDTINIAGATAAGVSAGEHAASTHAHTVSLGEKTTVTIAGLSAHDISKLHH